MIVQEDGPASSAEPVSERGPDEELLYGGVANAGAVTRQGDHVLRPSNPHSATIHGFLTHLHDVGFDGASVPIGIDPDRRERLVFIEGDVPIPPYPAWAQTNDVLASVAVLLRRYHDAGAGFVPPSGSAWSAEMIDPGGNGATDLVICHNDVCLENVVFRDGIAVGLLDFDFAAPGRPLYDLAQFARMCVPVDDDVNAPKLGWEPHDLFARLRLVADAYGLPPDRSEFLAILAGGIERGGQFVRRKVEEGDPNFIKMWNELGGMERFDRRRRWFANNAAQFAAALGERRGRRS
jgi:Phosphotransferase enzyme family